MSSYKYLVLHENILKRYFCKLLFAYKEVFSSPPWNAQLSDERWFDAVYERTFTKVDEGFLGSLAIDEFDNVVGFIWGYPLKFEGKVRKMRGVDVPRVLKLLNRYVRQGINKTIYWAEFGVVPPQQKKGIGSALFKYWAKIAKGKGSKSMYILADIEFPPFRENCLDLIVMFTVIHHINDPVDLIRKLMLLIRKAMVISVLKKTETAELLQTLIKSFPEAKVLNSQKSRDVIIVIEKTRVIQ